MRWRPCPRGQMKMRMVDLFQTLQGFNFQLRRCFAILDFKQSLKCKELSFPFRSLWTEPTWWTVETKWSFSLGKLCRVSSVRRWPCPIFVGLIQKLPSLSQMFGVSQPSYVDENLTDLPELENEDSERLRSFVASFTFHQNYFCHFLFLRQAWTCGRATLCLWGLSGMTPRLEHYSPGAVWQKTCFINFLFEYPLLTVALNIKHFQHAGRWSKRKHLFLLRVFAAFENTSEVKVRKPLTKNVCW